MSFYVTPVTDEEPSLLGRLQRYMQRPGVIDPGQGTAVARRVDTMLPERPMARALSDRWNRAPSGVEGRPDPGVPIVYRLPDEPRPPEATPVVASPAPPPPPERDDDGSPLRYESGGYQESGGDSAPEAPGGYRDGGYRQEGGPQPLEYRNAGYHQDDPEPIEYRNAGYGPADDDGGGPGRYELGDYAQPEPEPLPVVTGRVAAPYGGPGPVLRVDGGEPVPEPEPAVRLGYSTPVNDIDFSDDDEPVWPRRRDPGEGSEAGGLVLPPNAYLSQPDPDDRNQPYQVLPYEPGGAAERPGPRSALVLAPPPPAPEPAGPPPLPHPLARGQVLPARTDDGPGWPALQPDQDDDGDLGDEPMAGFDPFDDDDGPERPPLDEIDLALVVERVQRDVARRLEVERERRGGVSPWR